MMRAAEIIAGVLPKGEDDQQQREVMVVALFIAEAFRDLRIMSAAARGPLGE